MFFVSLLTYLAIIYLLYYKEQDFRNIIIGIISFAGVLSLVLSTQHIKQFLIFLVIIYIGSIFIKLGVRFLWKIMKSLEHRKKFITCFAYISLYIVAFGLP